MNEEIKKGQKTTTAEHPNITKMWEAFTLASEDPEFYESESKVKKLLDACKLPDPAVKFWKSSMTNAKKFLDNKAMEDAREKDGLPIVPTSDEIQALAIEKFKETWRKAGKGKPMPSLPITV